MRGKDNVVADALSRIETIHCPTVIDYSALADAQASDSYLTQYSALPDSKVVLKNVSLPTCNKTIMCEMSTDRARPYLPEQFRRLAFESIHNLSHPSIRVSRRLIQKSFFFCLE